MYCKSLIATTGTPRLTETLKAHVITLSASLTTVEQLNSLHTFTQNQPYLRDKDIKAGNLVYCLEDWEKDKQQEATILSWLSQQEASRQEEEAQPEEEHAVEGPSLPAAPYFITAPIRKCSYDRGEGARINENIEYTVQLYEVSGLPQIDFRAILEQATRETTGPGMDSFFARLARLARVSVSA